MHIRLFVNFLGYWCDLCFFLFSTLCFLSDSFIISVSSLFLILLVCLICCLSHFYSFSFQLVYFLIPIYSLGLFFFLMCACMWYIYLCVCTCACGCTHTCVNMKIRVDAWCPPQPLSSLFFATRSLTKPVARLAGQWGPERFILTPALKLWSHITGLASACILGIWTQVPMLSWQALNQLSHLPAT